ncbi:MAG: hypothetical protein WA624_14480, partial [Methylocella sp.]
DGSLGPRDRRKKAGTLEPPMGMARWFGDLRASPCFFYRNEQMNTRELAATFKVSRTQPHRWIKQGCPVPHSKCSRSPLRWSEQDVHAVREWLAARGNAAKSRTLRDVAKNLRVCLATLWTYRRAGCPMPPVRQDWSAEDFCLAREWIAQRQAQRLAKPQTSMRKLRLGRPRVVRVPRKTSKADTPARIPSPDYLLQNAQSEARHLYRCTEIIGQSHEAVLQSIPFSEREIELLKKSKGLGGTDFVGQQEFRKNVAREYRRLMEAADANQRGENRLRASSKSTSRGRDVSSRSLGVRLRGHFGGDEGSIVRRSNARTNR